MTPWIGSFVWTQEPTPDLPYPQSPQVMSSEPFLIIDCTASLSLQPVQQLRLKIKAIYIYNDGIYVMAF